MSGAGGEFQPPGRELGSRQPGGRPSPFFVVGVQRSGTTMLRLMLDSHPDIAVPFETGFITEFFPRLAEYGDLGDSDNARRLLHDIRGYHKVEQGALIDDVDAILSRPIRDYPGLVDAIMTQYAAGRGKRRWGDKTPFYITEIDVLWKIFPGCRIVHLVRDGRDVAVSQRRVSWAPTSILRIAEDWRWKSTLARKIGNVLGKHYLEVRYEDLVTDTEATLRRICEFLDVKFMDALLTYHRDSASRMPQRSMEWHKSSVSPPERSKVYAWKQQMSVADRILFEEIAGDALEMFGYERERRPKTLASRLKGLYFAVLRRW